jgi:uncharacterized protein (DUF58 family)
MPRPTPERILQRLDWYVIRKLDGILQGNYRTLFWGHGLDLADIREYQIGDDVRSIDWNVTARMGTPYVRQFLEDREITAWFLVDLSPSEDFGTERTLKRELAIDCITTLARLLTRRGNKVGAILYDGQVLRVVPVGSGKIHVLALIHELLQMPLLPRAPLTDLGVMLEAAGRAIKRRSLVFVISDFMTRPGWDKSLALLVQQHDVLVVHISDPCEHELPDMGLVTVEDAETGEQLFVDTNDPLLRRRYHEVAERHVSEIRTTCRRARVSVLELSTDDDLVKSLVRFIALRKQQRLYGVHAPPAPA